MTDVEIRQLISFTILLAAAVAYFWVQRTNRRRIAQGWSTEVVPHRYSRHFQELSIMLMMIALGMLLRNYLPEQVGGAFFIMAFVLLFLSDIKVWHRPAAQKDMPTNPAHR